MDSMTGDAATGDTTGDVATAAERLLAIKQAAPIEPPHGASANPCGDEVLPEHLKKGDLVWGEWTEDQLWFPGKVLGQGEKLRVKYDD